LLFFHRCPNSKGDAKTDSGHREASPAHGLRIQAGRRGKNFYVYGASFGMERSDRACAENELNSMPCQCMGDHRIGDLKTLRERIRAWSDDVNKSQRGVDWQMKIDDARCKLKSVYPKIKP
jgi:hypothetical protein